MEPHTAGAQFAADFTARGFTVNPIVEGLEFYAFGATHEDGRTAVRIATPRGWELAVDAPSTRHPRQAIALVEQVRDRNLDGNPELLLAAPHETFGRTCHAIVEVVDGHVRERRIALDGPHGAASLAAEDSSAAAGEPRSARSQGAAPASSSGSDPTSAASGSESATADDSAPPQVPSGAPSSSWPRTLCITAAEADRRVTALAAFPNWPVDDVLPLVTLTLDGHLRLLAAAPFHPVSENVALAWAHAVELAAVARLLHQDRDAQLAAFTSHAPCDRLPTDCDAFRRFVQADWRLED